jgi:1,2-diacylglycerol 3-beta-glucosyltransferase
VISPSQLPLVAMLAGVAAVFAYSSVMIVLGARRVPVHSHGDFNFVLLIPCLNEERVIGRTIASLLDLDPKHLTIIAIDDGSDDATRSIVRSFDDPRVVLLRRNLPHARKGKGEALNAAYRLLSREPALHGHARARLIVGVMDADGRLEKGTFDSVSAAFADPQTGGVQVAVRMANRTRWLARMQDVEFAVLGRVFQRGRSRLGSVGLGGNGQFTRVLALDSLASAPWSGCLTEDLELGTRLHSYGWNIAYVDDVAVWQQAVEGMRPLVRQRTRWFQGYLQCISMLPLLTGTPRATRAKKAEVSMSIMLPVVLLLMTMLNVVLIVLALFNLVRGPASFGVKDAALSYSLVFLHVPFVVYAYRRTAKTSFLSTIVLAHLYGVYMLIWVPAGMRAIWRQVRGFHRWDKTERTVDLSESAGLVDLSDAVTRPPSAPTSAGAAV